MTALVLLVASYTQSASQAQPASASLDKTPPIRFARTESGNEATLLLHEKRSVINLSVRAPVGPGTAPLPITKRLELWRPPLEAAFQGRGRHPEYFLTVGEYPELAGRLAVASVCSRKWEPRTGQPREEDAAQMVRGLIAQDRLTAELERLFDSLGYRAVIHSADSVLVCRWRDLRREVHASCPLALDDDALVPCGASLVFRLTAKN
jgi:hypothetical protein